MYTSLYSNSVISNIATPKHIWTLKNVTVTALYQTRSLYLKNFLKGFNCFSWFCFGLFVEL